MCPHVRVCMHIICYCRLLYFVSSACYWLGIKLQWNTLLNDTPEMTPPGPRGVHNRGVPLYIGYICVCKSFMWVLEGRKLCQVV